MPDPLGLFDDLTDAAAKAVADVFNGAMKAIWTFASLLLTGAFGIIDKYTTPDLNPTTGPLAGLFQQTLWIGVLIAVVMGFVQTGRAVMQGGRGFGRLFIGIGQYAVVTVAGLGILDTAVVASNQLSSSVLQTGLNIKDWKGINGQNSFFQDAVNIPSGVALGLVALLCVIPAAIGYLLEALVREGAIYVLAGTIPILAGGLVSDATRRWFWTGLRWMLALLLFPPVVAFTIVVGMKIAEGSVGANGHLPTDAVGQIVGIVVAGLTLLIALLCPMALFKLFAFVDPNTVSGGALQAFMGGGAGSSSGSSGQGGGQAGSSEGQAEEDTDNRFAGAMAGMQAAGAGAQAAGSGANNVAAGSSAVLDGMGAGHPGGPEAMEGDEGDQESDHQQGKKQQDQQESDQGTGGGSDDAVPAAPTGSGSGDGGSGDGGSGSGAAQASGDPMSAVAEGAQNVAPPSPSSGSDGPPDGGPSGGGGGGGGAAAGGGESAEIAVAAA